MCRAQELEPSPLYGSTALLINRVTRKKAGLRLRPQAMM